MKRNQKKLNKMKNILLRILAIPFVIVTALIGLIGFVLSPFEITIIGSFFWIFTGKDYLDIIIEKDDVFLGYSSYIFMQPFMKLCDLLNNLK